MSACARFIFDLLVFLLNIRQIWQYDLWGGGGGGGALSCINKARAMNLSSVWVGLILLLRLPRYVDRKTTCQSLLLRPH